MSEDILVRAKRVEYPDSALRILPELIAEVERLRNLPRADVAAYDRRIQEMAAKIKELEAEVEAKNKQIKELQDLIDKPPEDADWVADYHLLQSALDGPIIDAARKWHAAYRKAQNSNLMRAKEVERLRSDVNHWKLIAGEKHDDMISWMNECKKKDARIKELEAEREAMLGAMEKMTSIAVKLPEMVAHQKRLEAAFLKAEKANLMHHMDADYADENAREALERIKNESVPRK